MKNKAIYIAILISLVAGIAFGFLIAYYSGNNEGNAESGHVHELSTNEAGEEIWTCSMHPQIKLPEPGDCPICGMDLILLDNNSNNDSEIGFQMTENAVKIAGIQTTKIESTASQIGKELKISGKIAVNETNASNLVAHVPGRIEKLYISFTGESVRRGQKIAEVYSPALITAQRELIEAKKLAEISPDLFNSAKQKLTYWKLSKADIDEIITTETVREKFPIYAEHGGVVRERKVSVGDYLGVGEVLFAVQNLSSVWAEFDAYEKDLNSLSKGDKINFKVNSIPDRSFNGTIEFIDPIINPKTRVTKVRASVNNSNNRLKPEMFITGSIISESGSNNALIIPKTAVLWTGERSVVYVKVPDTELPSFEYKEVLLGQSLGNSYEIKEGLSSGELVVTNGAFVIDAASQLNNRNSMMNKLVDSPSKNAPELLPDYSKNTPKEFESQLEALVGEYLTLKENLVNTVAVDASATIIEFDHALNEIDMSLLEGKAHMYWMELAKALQTHVDLLKNNSEIEAQRKQFSFLSDIVIKSLKVYGINSNPLYVQYCPMAFDNKGAQWLSQEEFIQNPYFGDKMMKCGSIQDTIK